MSGQIQLLSANGQQLMAPEPEQRPLTPIERRMFALFGRRSARTGDLTRALVERQAMQLRQGMRKAEKPTQLRVVRMAAGRQQRERSRTSQ